MADLIQWAVGHWMGKSPEFECLLSVQLLAHFGPTAAMPQELPTLLSRNTVPLQHGTLCSRRRASRHYQTAASL